MCDKLKAKNPKYIGIKDKLKKITNVAKRRNKVDEIVNYEKDSKKLNLSDQV